MAINIYCPFIDLWQSQELSKRWDKTIQAIAKQAKEIRRIMLERQNSPYLATQDADAFLALKTKVSTAAVHTAEPIC